MSGCCGKHRKKGWLSKVVGGGTSLVAGILVGMVIMTYVVDGRMVERTLTKVGQTIMNTYNAIQDTRAILKNKVYTLPSGNAGDVSDIPPDVFQRMHDAVVRISFVLDGEDCQRGRLARGTGTIIHTDGQTSIILTNNHIGGSSTICGSVIESPQYMGVLKGTTIASSNKADLALIRVNKALTPSPIAKTPLKVHQHTVVIGMPWGLPWYTEQGFKEKENLNVLGSWAEQLSSHTYPGNSGSPVYNMKGEINGVIFAGIMGVDNIGFNIPLASVLEFLEEVNFPRVNRGRVIKFGRGYSTKKIRHPRKPYLPIDRE